MNGSVSILPSLAAFVLVIAMIPAAVWLLKRAQAMRPARDGALQLVAGLAVGPRERIAVVNVGERALVVGITAHGITHLATLDAPLPLPQGPQPGAAAAAAVAAVGAGSAFAQTLAARMRARRGPEAGGRDD